VNTYYLISIDKENNKLVISKVLEIARMEKSLKDFLDEEIVYDLYHFGVLGEKEVNDFIKELLKNKKIRILMSDVRKSVFLRKVGNFYFVYELNGNFLGIIPRAVEEKVTEEKAEEGKNAS